MKWQVAYTAVLAAGFLALGLAFGGSGSHTAPVARDNGPLETIYVRNLSPQFDSAKNIRHQIPAWEAAANGAFRTVYHTPRIRIVYLGKKRAPRRSIVALFVSKGPVQGALAYHTQVDGEPQIVVYTGTGDYYGFNNSVSFTHELFEMLGDEHTAAINQGWPYPTITLDEGQFGRPITFQTPVGQLLINELCDPVEAFSYPIHGVQISDWVTPNYFNDQQTMPAGVPTYDYMGLVQQPLEVLRGGYQSLFVVDFPLSDGSLVTGWVSVTNFRHAGRDAAGFLDDTHGRVIVK